MNSCKNGSPKPKTQWVQKGIWLNVHWFDHDFLWVLYSKNQSSDGVHKWWSSSPPSKAQPSIWWCSSIEFVIRWGCILGDLCSQWVHLHQLGFFFPISNGVRPLWRAQISNLMVIQPWSPSSDRGHFLVSMSFLSSKDHGNWYYHYTFEPSISKSYPKMHLRSSGSFSERALPLQLVPPVRCCLWHGGEGNTIFGPGIAKVSPVKEILISFMRLLELGLSEWLFLGFPRN